MRFTTPWSDQLCVYDSQMHPWSDQLLCVYDSQLHPWSDQLCVYDIWWIISMYGLFRGLTVCTLLSWIVLSKAFNYALEGIELFYPLRDCP